MGILETAFPIVRNVNAEILFIKSVPFGGNIVNSELPGEHLLFDFVAYHNVKGVGEFVGLGSNQGGLRFIYHLVEAAGSYIGELLREHLLKFGENRSCKSFASSDYVLKKSRLALVDTH